MSFSLLENWFKLRKSQQWCSSVKIHLPQSLVFQRHSRIQSNKSHRLFVTQTWAKLTSRSAYNPPRCTALLHQLPPLAVALPCCCSDRLKLALDRQQQTDGSSTHLQSEDFFGSANPFPASRHLSWWSSAAKHLALTVRGSQISGQFIHIYMNPFDLALTSWWTAVTLGRRSERRTGRRLFQLIEAVQAVGDLASRYLGFQDVTPWYWINCLNLS